MNRPTLFLTTQLGAMVSAIVLVLTFLASTPPARAAEQLYTCGMHPQIIKHEPGNCPICGMALTPVRSNAGPSSAEHKASFYRSSMNPSEVSDKPGKDSMGMDLIPVYEEQADPSQAIHIDAATIQRMNLKTALVTRGPVLREIRTVGSVAYNEQGLTDITTKYEGWIEKLFVGATWTAVKKGDPLFEIYSPELYNAELNYLVALRTEGDTPGPVTRASLSRLQLFDLPPEVVAEIAKTREPKRTFVFRAPSDGMIVEKMAVAGEMTKPGEKIYRIADLSSVWVLAQVFEQDIAFVRMGQEATVRVTYGPERQFTGTVESLLPQVAEDTRTATARIVLPNPDGYLRPGMFVDVRFAARLSDSAVLVPDLAVLRSGEHNTVFLTRSDGSFEPREVKLGERSQGNLYQVLSGLSVGDRIVTSGQFMLDSESQLRDAIQKMLKAPESGGSSVKFVQVEGTNGVSPPPTVGMDEVSALPDAARALLSELAFATVDAAEALAADDLAAYNKAVPKMRQTLSAFVEGSPQAATGPVAKFRDSLSARTDLKAARLDFAYFSTAVTDLAHENRLNQTTGLHIFQCPMAPGIRTGRWLSRSPQLKNPFYGSAMLECGDEIDTQPAFEKASRD